MDASGRDGSRAYHVRHDPNPDPEGEPEDDGSQYLNDAGEGIFDEEEPTDEGTQTMMAKEMMARYI